LCLKLHCKKQSRGCYNERTVYYSEAREAEYCVCY
jgi:hypothetical protein